MTEYGNHPNVLVNDNFKQLISLAKGGHIH